VAAKVAVVAPDCTTTVAGTLKALAMLLESDTVMPPVGAALEMVTLHVLEAEAARLPLPHCSDVICIDVATSERLVVAVTAFKLAVTDAG